MTHIYILGGLAIALVAWVTWSFFASNVEQAQYEIIDERDGYELRRYAPQLVAQTTVEGDFRGSMNEGFSVIAAYIFGDNRAGEEIAMTAPVTEERTEGESIAMTAPVTETEVRGERTIGFVMPSSYTRETLPVPNDPRVEIVEVPERLMAALRFGWYYSDARIAAKKQHLLELLARDGVEVAGEPSFAGYNAPFTFPLLIRNEVLVEVDR